MLNILCWGYPASVMAAALGLHQVKFEFANLCLVSVDKIFALFFYPMAAVVCPAFVIHIATFFHIAKVIHDLHYIYIHYFKSIFLYIGGYS
jgi:hypothetical protein